MTTTDAGLLTAGDLLRLHSSGVRGELIQGVLCETMSSGVEHGQVVMELGRHLGNFVVPQRLGRLIGSDSGVWLQRDPDTVREPDIAFISAAQLPLDKRESGYLEAVPRTCSRDCFAERQSGRRPSKGSDVAQLWRPGSSGSSTPIPAAWTCIELGLRSSPLKKMVI